MKKERTEINELGEFGLIDLISKDIKLKHKNSVLGIGDDAAILDAGNEYLLISSDMLIENVHFDLTYFPLKHLGYKAVAVNISDICAMNGTANQITVNIGISNRFSVEAIQEIYNGIKEACEEYNIDLVGGDTCSSTSGLILSITAIGNCKKDNIVKRTGAKPNDIICVTGNLGAAFLGLKKLTIEKKLFLEDSNIKPELKDFQYAIQRQMTPKARIDIINKLNELKIVPTSMIDISDGLASELLHISKMSKVGINVFEDKIPIDKEIYNLAEKLNLNPLLAAFNGGEDYELLFTISQKDFEKVKDINEITYIGYVQDINKGNYLVTKAGESIEIEAQGWKHF
ncbi:MAG: thiamine-phosphate kinase [Bacteroidetes bacterium]|nr:thiamine-phosphate kinase [Bacteroidota bacterium]